MVALDVASESEARQLIKDLSGQVSTFKVGSQLFTSIGPPIVREIQDVGAKVFLDLKFHDIPNTVRRAVESAVNLNVDMLTIHLSGGRAMCEAAIIGRGIAKTLLLGVTVLTHMTDNDLTETGYRSNVSGEVLLLAEIAKHTGITGLVASSQELPALRERFGSVFTYVIPGIRPSWAETGDQKRFMTPADAVRAGADYLVIGRPITDATNPISALQRIEDEIAAAEQSSL